MDECLENLSTDVLEHICSCQKIQHDCNRKNDSGNQEQCQKDFDECQNNLRAEEYGSELDRAILDQVKQAYVVDMDRNTTCPPYNNNIYDIFEHKRIDLINNTTPNQCNVQQEKTN